MTSFNQQTSLEQTLAVTSIRNNNGRRRRRRRRRRNALFMTICIVAALFSVFFLFTEVQTDIRQDGSTAKTMKRARTSSQRNNKGRQLNHTKRLLDAWDKLGNETYRLYPNFFLEASEEEQMNNHGGSNDRRRDDNANVDNNDDDVTLVVHLGLSKWARLLFSLRQWRGPASIAVFLNSRQDLPKFVRLWEESIGKKDDQLVARAHFHIMVENNEYEKEKRAYPFNYVRDLALRQVRTKYFLAADVDFVVPSVDTYDRLRHLIRDTKTNNVQLELSRKTFFVLPALDLPTMIDDDDLKFLPTNVTKQHVLRLLEKGAIQLFHLKSLDDTASAYGPTNYSRWVHNDDYQNEDNTTTSYQPFYFHKYHKLYEPYVLGETSLAPPYYFFFRGPGMNKASWFVEANCAGFKFAVLLDFFLIHLGHPTRWMGNREENLQEYRNFKDYLADKYYDHVDQCEGVNIRPTYTYRWWSLFAEERDGVEAAGFNEESWDRNHRPPSLQYSWDMLNSTDRDRLAAVGYDNKSWSETSEDHHAKKWVWD